MTRRSTSVTIHDVARQAGVSVATVSRFLNHNSPVSEEVAERIKGVMVELGYTPHAAARHLATRKTSNIGLLLTNMHNDFFAPLLSGIDAEVTQKGYNLLVATYSPELRQDFPPPIGPHNTDGLLVFADSLDEDQIRAFQQRKFPLVLIHRSSPSGLNIPSVTVENKAAARKIVDHLIEVHGKRRIIFMRGPIHQEDSYWREMGYKISLEEHGLKFDESLILNGGFEREIAHAALMAYASNGHTPFDAVFAGDDDAAIGVLTALKEMGKDVPMDVAVAGFDDLRLTSYLDPPLTTVRAPTEDVGRTAARKLFNLIEASPVEEVTLLPTEIILRRSCGCSFGTHKIQ
jgi:DNA-binding LacI/PurR family transcriptional regulator